MNTNTPRAAKIAQMGNSAWMMMLRGAVAILFGALAIAWPDLTLVWLVALFAVYALLGGGVSIAVALRSRYLDRKWWLPLLLGTVNIVAGVYAIVYPGLTAFTLLLVMGVNALITGALDIAIAIRFHKILRGHRLLMLNGVLSLLFGSLVLAAPGPGALALVGLIGGYAIVAGVLLLSLGCARGAPPITAASTTLAAGGR